MSIIIETDVWPVLRQKIHEERGDRLESLLHAQTLDGLTRQQGFIEALDWVMDASRSKPQSRNGDDDEG